jgi:hypothetical protein
MDEKSNGSGRKVRLITEPGAFGRDGHMVILRRWVDAGAKAKKKKINVESFVVAAGSTDEQLQEIERMKETWVTDPLFCSLTILRFVSETRVLAEPKEEKSKIVIPTASDVRRFNRSKYSP